MLILITRHGKAKDDSPTGRDEDRPLAGRGRRQSEYIAAELVARDLVPGSILASGHVRAWDTATIIGAAINRTPRREPSLELGHNSADVIDIIEAVRARSGAGAGGGAGGGGSLMLVGHNPQLEFLATVLLSGPALRGAGPILRTGECLVIDVDPDGLVAAGRLVVSIRLDEA